MPLDINNQNLLQDAQFQQFVDFAEASAKAGKQRAVARIDVGDIANRTIKPGSGDWVGIGQGRLASLKRANNATREAFRQAVITMFGGENHIPDSVKKAMKLEDYGKGKPLTVRRILAVKAAIEVEQRRSAAFAEAVQNAKPLHRNFDPGQVEASVKAAVAVAAADPDATKIVVKRIGVMLRRADATLRTPDDASKKAKAILDNVKELRAAAKGDRSLYDAGLAFLDQLGGKALPPGSIRAIFAQVKSLPVKAFKSVKPGAGPMKLHTAFVSFLKASVAAIAKSGAGAVLQDASERVPFRLFFGRLLAAKLDPRDLRNLHDALHGDDGRKLLLYYRDFMRIGFTGIDDGQLLKMDTLAARYRMQIEQFDGAIAQALGIDLDSYEGLDVNGRIKHEGSYVEDIAYDLLRTVIEDEAAQK